MRFFRMRMRKEILFIVVLAIILLVAPEATGASDSLTSTTSLFLVGNGARPLGMGDAFVGLADDENALFYNPAGLAFIEEAGVTSFYSNQFGVLQYGSVGYAQPKLGLGYLQLSSGELDEKDLYGNSTGTFNYTSRALIGAYATRLNDLSIALQGKAFTEVNPSTSSGYSLSPSFLYELEPFRFGGILRNLLYTDLEYTDDYTESWDEEFTLGVAYAGDHFNLNLEFDSLLTERGIDSGTFRAGAEMTLFPHVTGRLGVTSELKSSAGLSVELERFQIDYAYSFHQQLSETHRLSFTARFEKLVGIG